MAFLIVKVSIVLVCLLPIIRINCEPIEIWGDITKTQIRGIVKAKYAIPFVIRTISITYPDVSDGINYKGHIGR